MPASLTLNTLPADMPEVDNWATPTEFELGWLRDKVSPIFKIFILSPVLGAAEKVKILLDVV